MPPRKKKKVVKMVSVNSVVQQVGNNFMKKLIQDKDVLKALTAHKTLNLQKSQVKDDKVLEEEKKEEKNELFTAIFKQNIKKKLVGQEQEGIGTDISLLKKSFLMLSELKSNKVDDSQTVDMEDLRNTIDGSKLDETNASIDKLDSTFDQSNINRVSQFMQDQRDNSICSPYKIDLTYSTEKLSANHCTSQSFSDQMLPMNLKEKILEELQEQIKMQEQEESLKEQREKEQQEVKEYLERIALQNQDYLSAYFNILSLYHDLKSLVENVGMLYDKINEDVTPTSLITLQIQTFNESLSFEEIKNERSAIRQALNEKLEELKEKLINFEQQKLTNLQKEAKLMKLIAILEKALLRQFFIEIYNYEQEVILSHPHEEFQIEEEKEILFEQIDHPVTIDKSNEEDNLIMEYNTPTKEGNRQIIIEEVENEEEFKNIEGISTIKKNIEEQGLFSQRNEYLDTMSNQEQEKELEKVENGEDDEELIKMEMISGGYEDNIQSNFNSARDNIIKEELEEKEEVKSINAQENQDLEYEDYENIEENVDQEQYYESLLSTGIEQQDLEKELLEIENYQSLQTQRKQNLLQLETVQEVMEEDLASCTFSKRKSFQTFERTETGGSIKYTIEKKESKIQQNSIGISQKGEQKEEKKIQKRTESDSGGGSTGYIVLLGLGIGIISVYLGYKYIQNQRKN